MSMATSSTGTVLPITKQSARDLALFMASRKLRLIPIPPRTKAPIIKDWPNQGTSDPATIAGCFNADPASNYGIICAGLLVIDIDPRHGGDLWLEDNEHRLPDTWRFRTGGGGWHVVFRATGLDIGNRTNLAPGVDIRGTGGQIVGPGSVHPDGGRYEIEAGPGDVDLADAPVWLVDLAKQPKPKPTLNGEDIEEGARDASLASICGALLHKHDAAEVRRLLH
jgi:hypothetical protein